MVVNSCESEVARASGSNKKKNYAAASRDIFLSGHCGYFAGVPRPVGRGEADDGTQVSAIDGTQIFCDRGTADCC